MYNVSCIVFDKCSFSYYMAGYLLDRPHRPSFCCLTLSSASSTGFSFEWVEPVLLGGVNLLSLPFHLHLLRLCLARTPSMLGAGDPGPFHSIGQAPSLSARLGVITFSSTSPLIFIEGEQRSKCLVPRQKQTQHFNE